MRYVTGLRSVALGLLGASALATALYAQEGGGSGPWRGAGPTPCRLQRRRRQQVPAGAAGHGDPRRPAVRQQDRGDAAEADHRPRRRAHHRGRPGIPGQGAGRCQGDRSQPGDGAARPDRRPHPHVQSAQAGNVAGDLDAHRRAEPAGRPCGRLHHRARHELPRQRLWRRRHAQRHQRRPHRRPALRGVRPRHRVGRAAADRAG